MKYGEMLGRSFRALGSGGLWAFGLTALLVVAAPFALVWGLVVATGAPALLGPALGMSASEAQMFGALVTFYVTMLLGLLLAIVPIVVARGGLIHAADAAVAGRSVRVGECWSFGLRHTGRTFGIDAILGLLYMLAIVVIEIPFILVVALGSAATGEGNPAALIATICCGYPLLFAGIIAIVFVFTGVEALSIRYGLIGGRTFGDAIASGWKAFRVSWKRVVVFALIMVSLAYAWQLLSSIVTLPLLFVTLPFRELTAVSPDPAVLGRFFDGLFWVYAVMILFQSPFLVFNIVAWTVFFRRLTGLDPIAAPTDSWSEPVAPPQQPAPDAPAAAFPPAPPQPPGDPSAGA